MEPGYVFGSKEGDADEGEIEVEGGGWKGIYKEGGVGIFSDEEYRVLMGIALKSMGQSPPLFPLNSSVELGTYLSDSC
jgi:hypothetical protein